MLIRRVRPVRARPRIRVRLRPTFEWGARQPEYTRGSNHLRFVGPNHPVSPPTLRSPMYSRSGPSWSPPDLVLLRRGRTPAFRGRFTAREFLEETIDYWRDWVRSLSVPFDWQEAVIRASITLKLCNFEETGAIVAALTTSVPEAPGTERNWDYRYCWLRDAYFRHSRAEPARHDEDDGGIPHLHHEPRRRCGGQSRPEGPAAALLHHRSTDLDERTATALRGYRGMGPVRVGNAAYTQIQNDAYGSVILASTHAFFDKRLIRPANQALFDHLEKLGSGPSRCSINPTRALGSFARGPPSIPFRA